MRQVGEWVDLLLHCHLLDSWHCWHGHRAVRWGNSRLQVSVPISVPVPVPITVPVSGPVLTVSVTVPVSPVNKGEWDHVKYFYVHYVAICDFYLACCKIISITY